MYALARKLQSSALELAILNLVGTSKKTSVVVGKCRLSIGYKHGWLWLYGVHVSDEHRGKGYAALAMQELITCCDKLSIKIKLEAVPLDDDGDMKRLVGFYKRFGFREKHVDKNAITMERKPSTSVKRMKGIAMSLKNISRELAVAGVQHRVVVAKPVGFKSSREQDELGDVTQKTIEAVMKDRVAAPRGSVDSFFDGNVWLDTYGLNKDGFEILVKVTGKAEFELGISGKFNKSNEIWAYGTRTDGSDFNARYTDHNSFGSASDLTSLRFQEYKKFLRDVVNNVLERYVIK